MRIPEANELLAGINHWTAIESKSNDPVGIAAMVDEAQIARTTREPHCFSFLDLETECRTPEPSRTALMAKVLEAWIPC